MAVGAVEQNKQAIRQILAAYEEGKLEPLLGILHEDIDWFSNAPESHYRFGGHHKGKAALREGLSFLANEYTIHSYTVRELIGEDNVVWATSDVVATHRATAMRVSAVLVNRWQFDGDKVVAFTEFFDTAGVLVQEGRIAGDLSRAMA
ncbi:MAG TPA: nuclear transport factor 2 family protein [Rhizomicrobium sp.]|jgi:ketosteroid isomerase-like protein